MLIKPKKITKPDLIAEVSRKLNKNSKDVREVIDGFLAEMALELKNGNRVAICGFFDLQTKPCKRNEFFCPRTQKIVRVNRTKRIAMSASHVLRNKVCQ